MQLLKMGRAEDPLPPQKLPDYRLTPGPVDRIGELPDGAPVIVIIGWVARRHAPARPIAFQKVATR